MTVTGLEISRVPPTAGVIKLRNCAEFLFIRWDQRSTDHPMHCHPHKNGHPVKGDAGKWRADFVNGRGVGWCVCYVVTWPLSPDSRPRLSESVSHKNTETQVDHCTDVHCRDPPRLAERGLSCRLGGVTNERHSYRISQDRFWNALSPCGTLNPRESEF